LQCWIRVCARADTQDAKGMGIPLIGSMVWPLQTTPTNQIERMEEEEMAVTDITRIGDKMAGVINKHLGTNIEVTYRGTGKYTISGTPNYVNKAVQFVTDWGMFTEESRVYDEELEESFVYLREN
jgi:hypothetical protein